MTTQARDFKKAYETPEPAVIVLDVVMPDVDGIELVQWLAAMSCKAKVIIVTGYNPHYAEIAREIGALRGLERVETFTKPLDISGFRAALR